MARVLSHPLRLAPGGGFATNEQDDEASLTEQLAVLLLTKTGERALVPFFGVPDPTFNLLTEDEVALAVEMYGPPIEIESVDYVITADGRAEVTVAYDNE